MKEPIIVVTNFSPSRMASRSFSGDARIGDDIPDKLKADYIVK
jgi:hypothetical protein